MSDTRLIPSDLSARLSVAEGLVDASDDEWLDYCGMFERAARPVKLADFTDYQGLNTNCVTVNYETKLSRFVRCSGDRTVYTQQPSSPTYTVVT